MATPAANDSLEQILASGTSSKANWTSHEELLLSDLVIFSGVFVLISGAGLIGNILVIVAIAGDPKMRKSTMNALLLNLAAADLCNVIACVPEFVLQLLNRGWLMPHTLCPLLRFLERVFLYTSLLTQLAVGIERFYAIAFPMKVHLLCSRRKVAYWIIFLWLTAMGSSLPYAWHQVQLGRKTGKPYCIFVLDPRTQFVFGLAECLLFYFVPLALIMVLYTFVSIKLWSRGQHLHEGRSDSGPSETLKTRQNVVKMLIVCICVYFVGYSPIQAIFVSRALFGRNVVFGMTGNFSLNLLAYSCSAANPIVYTLYSHRFRRKFAQLLCCRRYYERNSTTGPSNSSWVHSNHYSTVVNNNFCASNSTTPCRNFVVKDSKEPIHNDDETPTHELTSRLLSNNPRTKPSSPRSSTSINQLRLKGNFKRNSSSPSLHSTATTFAVIQGDVKKTVLYVDPIILRRSPI